MERNSKIYVAGHTGMVGSAVIRKLKEMNYTNLVIRSSKELNLTDQSSTDYFFNTEKPEFVIVAAARVGGISDTIAHPADFLMQNLQMECNLINSAHNIGVKKLLFISSAVVYPVNQTEDISEESYLTGKLDDANQSYALSKICGMQLCSYYKKQYKDNFFSVVPCNLYGIGDNFSPSQSHLVAGMIQRFHEAKLKGQDYVDIWGTGYARRELLCSDDLADAIVMLMNTDINYDFINVGFGNDMTIKEIAKSIAEVIEFKGQLRFDDTKPEGAKRRLLNSNRLMDLGWKPKIEFKEGIKQVYDWYISEVIKT